MLGGGRGTVLGALAGAFALESLFMLLNFTPVPSTMRDSIQGVIIILAVAYSGFVFTTRRKRTTNTEQVPADELDPPPTDPIDPAGVLPPLNPAAGNDAVREKTRRRERS